MPNEEKIREDNALIAFCRIYNDAKVKPRDAVGFALFMYEHGFEIAYRAGQASVTDGE